MTTSSKSLTYTAPLSSPHLTFSPVPSTILPTQILIKVHAGSINPVDIQLWGNPVVGYLAGKKEKGFGRDYAGVVVAVGGERGRNGGGDEDDEGFEVGDRVFGLFSRPTGEGTFAQHVLVDRNDPIAKIPAAWSFEEAASVPLTVLTAWQCLEWLPKAKGEGKKRKVVVAGASGGVGIWCVQLAKKLRNCHITAICSARNAPFVTSLGADTTIDYISQDPAQTLISLLPSSNEKYDLYIDCVGGTSIFPHLTTLLHPNAAYVTIVGDKTSRTSIGGPLTYFTYPAQVWRFLWGWVVGPRYANVLLCEKSEVLRVVGGLVERGQARAVLQEVVGGVLDEDEGVRGEAWEKVRGLMEGGRVRGKVVVNIE